MNEIYSGLGDYFSFGFADVSQAGYFDGLPKEIRQAVLQNQSRFHSFEEMKAYAEKQKHKHKGKKK
ncbi:hypothetical protein [Provencibacterium massiliense]|uniref:hypothetical protein n=1 Tax=Provencibacterium massiliense TaxID=1841868 RepID=UPI0009A794FE|nr:hypothetical protein [Provencibacterium massiliense]RGB65744.1 hypothetical protein DW086_10000 [Harryflintia acetispora]